MKSCRRWRSLSPLALPLLLAALAAAPAHSQHPAVNLYDKDFNLINPVTGANAGEPFSAKNTCGTCHDYETITSGYHFQMGWDKVSDDFGVKQGTPWSLSDGFMGRWYPYAFRQLARKKNTNPNEIDMTVYDFVGFSLTGLDQPPCGACHPGGGGLEHDREGNRYDDHLRENPQLRESLDGDYYQSNWDKSGVVEADCFLCHLKRYDFSERVNQFEKGNYRWAVVAATGLGIVEGSVKGGEKPKVTYNLRFFNADGTVTPAVVREPPSANCLFCHGTSDVKKRGLSWDDIHNPDVHNQQGLGCTACHTAGLDHQIGRAGHGGTTAGSEPANQVKRCEDCHSTGYMGATIPVHRSIRPSHLETIACETCHVPHLNRAAALGFDATTGKLAFTINPPEAKEFGAAAQWKPVYQRRADGKIYPFNDVLATWWGNLDEDGILYPLFLREHEAAWELFQEAVTDDNGDGEPEVNRDEEIIAGLKAFSQSLAGNRRFHRIHPVLVKGGKAYHLDEAGRLMLLDYDLTGMTEADFPISHVIAPVRLALGAHGCQDCHRRRAYLFAGRRLLDLCGADGRPVTEDMGIKLGCNRLASRINALYQEIFRPYIELILTLVVFLVVFHYHGYGPKRIPFEPFRREVKRFSLPERIVHLLRLISFAVLAFTGLIMAFNLARWQELFFASPDQMLAVHIGFGIVFLITTVTAAWLWFEDAVFASHDKDWVRILGGYLGHKGHIPAGRFNAGQKMFYWYTAIFGFLMGATGLVLIFKQTFGLSAVLITSVIHNFIGFLLIAGVLAHAYLGTIANPGTWQVLVDGYVSKVWAKHHHPLWYQELAQEGKIEATDGGE